METIRELFFSHWGVKDTKSHYTYKVHTYPKVQVTLGDGPLLWDDRPGPQATLTGAIDRAIGLFTKATTEERENLLYKIQRRNDFRENRTGPGCYDYLGEWMVALGSEAFLWSVLAVLDETRTQRSPGDLKATDFLWLLQHTPKGYIHNVAAVLAYDQYRDGFTPLGLVNLGLQDNPENPLLTHLRDLIKAGVKGPGAGPIPHGGDFPEEWFKVTIPQETGFGLV